jgi:hypothetical protein
MFALSKWVYCQSCQGANCGALNLQSSMILQKLAAKAAGKAGLPSSLVSVFPTKCTIDSGQGNTLEITCFRSSASAHSLFSGPGPPTIAIAQKSRHIENQFGDSHSSKVTIAIDVKKMRLSLCISRLFLQSFEDNLRHGTPFPLSPSRQLPNHRGSRHSRLLPAPFNLVQRSQFHADL